MSLFYRPKTTSNLVEAMNTFKIPMKTKKTVRFSELCKVILIPMRQEYSAAGIFLWWTRTDFLSFKQVYLIEKQRERERTRIGNHESTLKSQMKRRSHLLIVSENKNHEHLLSLISRSMTLQPTIQICSFTEIESLHQNCPENCPENCPYDAIIIDGTEECECFRNQSCERHSLNRLHVIQLIRSLSLSKSLTLFVDNSSFSSQSIREMMTENESQIPSDLMIITPDSWSDFQLLIERAIEK